MKRDNSLQFPNVVEAELLRPYANHAPAVAIILLSVCEAMWINEDLQQDNAKHDRGEHCFCVRTKTLLDPPEAIDSNGLGTDTKEKEIGQGKSVIRDDCILKCGDHCDGSIERVAQEKVPYRFCKL